MTLEVHKYRYTYIHTNAYMHTYYSSTASSIKWAGSRKSFMALKVHIYTYTCTHTTAQQPQGSRMQSQERASWHSKFIFTHIHAHILQLNSLKDQVGRLKKELHHAQSMGTRALAEASTRREQVILYTICMCICTYMYVYTHKACFFRWQIS